MDATDLNRLTTTQVNRLKDDRNTIGILLFGSAANGGFDELSDIDIYCVTKESAGLARETLRDAESNLTVEVLYGVIDDLSRQIKQEQNSVYRTVSSILASGKVLYAADDSVDKLIEQAVTTLRSPASLTPTQSIMIRYSLDDFYTDAIREHKLGHRAEFSMYADKLIQNAIEASFRVNGGYFEPPKKLLANLKKTDEKLHELLNQYYASDFKDQLDELKTIRDYVLSLLGGPVPQDWNVPA